MMEQSLPTAIGARLSQRRGTLGLKLDEVAARTGVSRAMISRVERGEVNASAAVLDKLCAGLGMTLSELFSRDANSPLARRAEQPSWTDPVSGYTRREIAPPGTGSKVRIVEVDFPPGAEVTLEKSRFRVIEQHVWLLAGEIEIALPTGTFVLAPGDCLHMSPNEGITFRNPGKEPARYAVILTTESAA
jgi:transcriptional regulator with XRE-family HTH domain